MWWGQSYFWTLLSGTETGSPIILVENGIDRYPFIRSNKTFWPCSQCQYSVKVGSAICPDWRLLSGRMLLCLDNQSWSKVVITEPDWSKLGRTPALDWGADWHGEGGRAHQRDAADPRGVWCYLRPFVQTTPEVEQTGAPEDWGHNLAFLIINVCIKMCKNIFHSSTFSRLIFPRVTCCTTEVWNGSTSRIS